MNAKGGFELKYWKQPSIKIWGRQWCALQAQMQSTASTHDLKSDVVHLCLKCHLLTVWS